MRSLLLLLILAQVFSCTIVQETHFNKDKSGSVSIAMNFENMEAMAGMMMGGEMTMNEETGEKEGPKDTSFVFYDIMPDSVKGMFPQVELLKNIRMSIHSDESKSKFGFLMEVGFDNVAQIDEILKLLEQAKEQGGTSVQEDFAGFDNFLGGIKDIEWGDDYIRIPEFNMSETEEFKEMNPGLPMFESDEEKKEMEEMLQQLQFKSIYYMPGVITSCDCPKATYEGNRLEISMKLSDFMDSENVIIPSMYVRFKK